MIIVTLADYEALKDLIQSSISVNRLLEENRVLKRSIVEAFGDSSRMHL